MAINMQWKSKNTSNKKCFGWMLFLSPRLHEPPWQTQKCCSITHKVRETSQLTAIWIWSKESLRPPSLARLRPAKFKNDVSSVFNSTRSDKTPSIQLLLSLACFSCLRIAVRKMDTRLRSTGGEVSSMRARSSESACFIINLKSPICSINRP